MNDDPNRINCLIADIIPRYLGELQSCKEDFPQHGRIIFSSVSMVIQYLLPTLTISIAYWQIYGQLKMRLDQKMNQLSLSVPTTNDDQHDRRRRSSLGLFNNINSNSHINSNHVRRYSTASHVVARLEQEISRMRRTIHLLMSVGMVFCICWMPLNILNTVSRDMRLFYFVSHYTFICILLYKRSQLKGIFNEHLSFLRYWISQRSLVLREPSSMSLL